MPYYKLIIIVLLPSIVSLIANGIIFNHAWLSSRRVQLYMVITSRCTYQVREQGRIRRRDIRLLKQIIMMFCVHILGWAPLYIASIINIRTYLSSVIYNIFFILAQISTLSNVFNLFLYHYEVREYLMFRIRKLI